MPNLEKETRDILYIEQLDHIYTRRGRVEEIEEEVTHDEADGRDEWGLPKYSHPTHLGGLGLCN